MTPFHLHSMVCQMGVVAVELALRVRLPYRSLARVVCGAPRWANAECPPRLLEPPTSHCDERLNEARSCVSCVTVIGSIPIANN